MKFSTYSIRAAFVLGLLACIAGCDIAPEERLTGTPIGGSSSATLDPEDAANITAYFYAGASDGTSGEPGVPVAGLGYNCSLAGYTKATGYTDADGRFVCPRSTLVTFSIGVAGSPNQLPLGQVPLSIFGNGTDAATRNKVAITPGTLYGTATDGSRREVANIFNLLASLDASYTTAPRQKKIEISEQVHALLSSYADFGRLTLADGIDQFSRDLEAVVGQVLVDTAPDVILRIAAARPAAPVLSETEATALANASLQRARAGLYRIATLVVDSESVSGKQFWVQSSFVVGNEGVSAGYVESHELIASPSAYNLSLLVLGNSATVGADGQLVDFIFGSGPGEVTFGGSFVNDGIFGESRLCNASSANSAVPSVYCTTPSFSDGFESADLGVFSTLGTGYTGELYLNRIAEALPDIDLDLLDANFLPRTYEMQLERYSDIQQADFANSSYSAADADKAAFGALVPAGSIRYTLMPNGDIVSDDDDDCADLSLVGGRYQDADGSPEYLLGRVGNVFNLDFNEDDPDPAALPDNRPYLTMQFAIMDAAHPQFGFNFGFPALRRPIYPVVLEVATGRFISKSAECDPRGGGGSCLDKLEWFNDVTFFRDVYSGVVANGDNPVANDLLFRNSVYYGQVRTNAEITGATGICRPAPP